MELGAAYQAVVGACTPASVFAFPTKLAPLRASLCIDTGSSVNLLDFDCYLALRRESRGGRYALRPSDLTLTGVAADRLDIRGVVRLPISLGKYSPLLYLDFYVIAGFALSCDGLIGLPSLREHGISVFPKRHSITFAGRTFVALDEPRRLAFPWARAPHSERHVQPPTASASAQPTPRPPAPWAAVPAVVLGRHEVSAHCAYAVPVAVTAPVGSHVCFEEASLVRSLTLEPTLSSVEEGARTVALVLNTSGVSVRLLPGVCLTRALAYGTSLTDERLPPSAPPVGVVAASTAAGEGTQSPLDSHVKVIDYPHLRPRLLETLHKFRGTIALPGEPLGTTSLTQHTINLKPGTAPIYTPAYRLPHSQHEIVDKQIAEMKEHGIIADSRSPWNSPFFLVPPKDGTFRPVIDFRRLNSVTQGEQFPLPVLSDLLMNLGEGNKFFFSLDLLSGYWQVPMDPESRKFSSFSTKDGHFEWLRMPFGLKTAPMTFQRMITMLLGDLKSKKYLCLSGRRHYCVAGR